MTKVGIIDVLATPYDVWRTRDATVDESLEMQKQGYSRVESLTINEHLTERIATHKQAASYLLREGLANGLESHIDRALEASIEYCAIRALMPSLVPPALEAYQGMFLASGLSSADAAIRANGIQLAEGQMLFHGGCWPGADSIFETTRPFSTSFCPQVALRNAEWKGKAYDADRLELMVVRVAQAATRAYIYGREGSHGHEKEVVFAGGARLTLIQQTRMKDVMAFGMASAGRPPQKMVPTYLLEVALS